MMISDFSEDTPKQESIVDYSSASSEQIESIRSALDEGYIIHECLVIPANGEYQGYWIGARFTADGNDRKGARIGIW
ncbi:MAG: hypothetical protein L7U83_10155, partial [Akkermansiaceae bacterium]|nr:hypothetical protein [Akkermansiaceae bacterium]